MIKIYQIRIHPSKLIDFVFKMQACINKAHAFHDAKLYTYVKKEPQATKKDEVNHVDQKKRQRDAKPKRHFTKLIDIVDNILNVLLDEDIIELPPIVEPKFPNGVPKHFHYEEFYNYNRVLGHLT